MSLVFAYKLENFHRLVEDLLPPHRSGVHVHQQPGTVWLDKEALWTAAHHGLAKRREADAHGPTDPVDAFRGVPCQEVVFGEEIRSWGMRGPHSGDEAGHRRLKRPWSRQLRHRNAAPVRMHVYKGTDCLASLINFESWWYFPIYLGCCAPAYLKDLSSSVSSLPSTWFLHSAKICSFHWPRLPRSCTEVML